MNSDYWNVLLFKAVIGAVTVFAAAMFGIWMGLRKRNPIIKEMEALSKRGDELIVIGDRLLKSKLQNKEQWEAWSARRIALKEEFEAFDKKRLGQK